MRADDIWMLIDTKISPAFCEKKKKRTNKKEAKTILVATSQSCKCFVCNQNYCLITTLANIFTGCKNEFLILLKFPSYKYFRFIHISHIISLHNCMCRYISSNKCIFELLFFFVTQCLHVNFLKCLLFSIYQHQTRKCSYIFTLSVLRYISSVIYPP